MALLMFLLVVPYQSAVAAMIGTETVLELAQGKEARDYLNGVLAREDVKTALEIQGINPLEARARVDALSDAEVVCLAEQTQSIAGGFDTMGWVIGGLFVMCLVLAIIGFFDQYIR